jgi:hypothetical protein
MEAGVTSHVWTIREMLDRVTPSSRHAMTREEQRAVAELMRRLATYMAERRCLITIREEAVRRRRLPDNWERELLRLRQTPEYHAVLEEFERTIS